MVKIYYRLHTSLSLCQTHFSFHVFTLISNTSSYARVYIFFFLSFYCLLRACGCLLHTQPVEKEWHSSTVTKDDSTSRAHKPPGPGAFASYGPQSSKQTSVLLWKKTFDLRAKARCQINEEK